MRELVNFIRTLYHKLDLIINDLSFEIIFVMGNSSSDMDSFITSCMVAFLRNIESRSISYTNQHEITYNNYSRINKLYLPVINCKKGELFWRLDIAEILHQVELEEDDFIYFEDIYDNKENFEFDKNFVKRSRGNYFLL
jgi:inorganic pyrophosphatase/exopolyphosphatase